jgi:hypothetical protein
MTDISQPNIATMVLVNLVRLLAAELVAGKHRDDLDHLLRAINRKIEITPLPRGVDVNDARSAFGEVRKLLSPVFVQLREQTKLVRISECAKNSAGHFKHLQ